MTAAARKTRPVETFSGTVNPQRKILEKVFFHDILNLAGSVQGLMEVMNETDSSQKTALSESVQAMADQLVDEIIAHRDFLCAESGDLEITNEPLRSDDLLFSLQEMFRAHPLVGNRTLWVDPTYDSFIFHSDRNIIHRILTNMLKNALEAARKDDVITMSCGREADEVWFSVHNPGEVAPDAKPWIFKPSYSTKGAGRGLGTYSMRLLSETYLDGRIGFESDPAHGTTFRITLPVGAP